MTRCDGELEALGDRKRAGAVTLRRMRCAACGLTQWVSLMISTCSRLGGSA